MMRLKNRILTRTGVSVLEDSDMALKIALGEDLGEHLRVEHGPEALAYQKKYAEEIIASEFSDMEELPDLGHTYSDVDDLINALVNAPRYRDEYESRLLEEVGFFDDTQNIKFIFKLKNLIDRFKKDGVVWGVGRGSSCASVVLYLLEVHDIDPVAFDIPFSELSKEK